MMRLLFRILKVIVLVVVGVAVIGSLYLSITSASSALYWKEGKSSYPTSEQKYVIFGNPYGSENEYNRIKNALYKIANERFVKGLSYGSTPAKIHKILGKPYFSTESSITAKAMQVEDRVARDDDHGDTGGPSYPDSYRWKETKLPASGKGESYKRLAETYVINIKFFNGHSEKRYWHIYYDNGRATSQSYAVSIKKEEWERFLENDSE